MLTSEVAVLKSRHGISVKCSRYRDTGPTDPSLESTNVVKFDLEPLLQGQMRTAKFKSAYNSRIIDPRGLQCETNL